MTRDRSTIIMQCAALAVLAVVVSLLRAQGGSGSQGQDRRLDQILLDRPEVPITEPKRPDRSPRPRRDLPADGSMVVDARCRLEREAQTGWFILRFLPSGDGSAVPVPRRVLQCELLEQMEAIIAKNPRAVFRVSGETTVFMNRCFLMPHKVTVEGASGPVVARPREDEPVEQATSMRTGATKASSEDILSQLVSEDLGRPVVPESSRPDTPRRTDGSVAPAARQLIVAEPIVVNRVVRILPEQQGGWLVARFESDNTLQEPPVRLLPSALLETARKLRKAGPTNLAKLQISGNITWYHGRRYLLLRSVIPVRHMGQF